MAATARALYTQYFTSSKQSGIDHHECIINVLLLGEETIARREWGPVPSLQERDSLHRITDRKSAGNPCLTRMRIHNIEIFRYFLTNI
jgi:hypothetical protein